MGGAIKWKGYISFYPYKKGVGGKCFSYVEGGGRHKKLLGSFDLGRLGSSHTEGGGGGGGLHKKLPPLKRRHNAFYPAKIKAGVQRVLKP